MRAHGVLPALALLIVLAAVPAVAAFASGSADDTDPLLVYRGASTVTADGSTATVNLTIDVDCTTDPCLATAQIVIDQIGKVSSLTADQSYPVRGGHVSADVPEFGSVCELTFIGAGPLSIDFSTGAAHLVRVGAASPEVSCPDGSQTSIDTQNLDLAAVLVAGTECLLDRSCPTPTPTPTVVTPHAGPSAGRPLDQPSVLSTLPTFASVATTGTVAWAATGSAVLVLLIALPTALFDSAAERISASRRTAPRARLTLVGWPFAVLGLVIAAGASVFVDPRIAADAAGVRTLVSILVSLLVTVALGWWLVSAVVRARNPTASVRLEFRPLTLVIVAVAVVVSRLLGFEPGVVFGLVAGVVIGGAIGKSERGGVAALGVGWSLVAGFGSWIGYSALASGTDVGTLFTRETLAAIAVAGMSALPIALLPLRGLIGRDLWRGSKLLWVVAYVVAVFAFVLVLVPAPFAWDAVDLSVGTWALLIAGYALVATATWLAIVRPWRRHD